MQYINEFTKSELKYYIFLKVNWFIPILLAALLILISFYNFLLFHTLAEFFAIMVAIITCVVAWQMYPFTRNNFLTFLGNGYFWIAMLDLLHALTYKGMNIFPISGGNLPIQFWISTRYSEALLLLAAPLFLTRTLSRKWSFAFFGLSAVTLYILVMSGNFPDTFIEGKGLTKFKIYSEFIIIGILALAIYHLWSRRTQTEKRIVYLMAISIVFTMIAELAFTFYVSLYGLSNMIGHIFKLFSFWLIFTAVVRTTLQEPFLAMARGSSTYDAVPDATIVVDKGCKIRQINKEASQLAGISEDELLGRHCHDVFHSTSLTVEQCPVCQNAKNGISLMAKEIEFPETHKWFDFSTSPIKILGETWGMVQVIRDITERKMAEKTLRESEERLRSLTQSASDAIISADSEGNIISWNKGAKKIFGYSENEVLGLSLTILMPERYRVAHLKGLKRSVSTKEFRIIGKTVELQGLKKDGSEFPLDISIAKWVTSQGIFFSAIIRNISRRKESEKTLRKLNNAIEQTVEGVVITNTKGIIEYVNPAVEKITGYSNEELIGQNTHTFKYGIRDEKFRKEMWETINSGKVWQGKIVNKRKSGEVYDEEMTISPVIDNKGNTTNYVAIKRDVSKEKGLQKQLIQAEKLSSIGTFISGVAHELNNPLTAILGFSERIIKKKNPPPDIKKNLQTIADQAERAVTIVKNLLKFSRKHEERKSPININEVLEDTLNLHKYRLHTDHIEIRRNIKKKLLPVMGNSGQLQQVFMNIIMNAHYEMISAHGKGVLKVTTGLEDNEIIITLENDGPLIPEDKLDSIFDPFYTTKEAGEGTGLGMYISFGIIQDHSGRIRVENINNSGVRFTISLPVLSKEEEEEAKAEGEYAKKQACILIVDDEDPIREWLGEVLIDEGFTVIPAKNGKEAMDILKGREFDIVISDVKMPDISGLDLAKWVYENKPECIKKFFFATGVIDKEIGDFCTKYGCNAITKPFREKDLLEAINKTLK